MRFARGPAFCGPNSVPRLSRLNFGQPKAKEKSRLGQEMGGSKGFGGTYGFKLISNQIFIYIYIDKNLILYR
jgi:hypothetical protein